MTNRIVVGVDGSDHSAQALRWAVEVGTARGWPVTAVAVWAFLDQRHPGHEVRFDPDYTQVDARAALASYVEEAVGTDRAGTIEQEVVNDLAAHALVELAGAEDLLVVGPRVRGAIGSFLLGSVSSACLHHSRGPIAVIRAGVDLPAPHEHRRVVAAVDGSTESLAALRWAAEHAAAIGATLEVIHAWHAPLVTGGAIAYVPIDPSVFEHTARETLGRAMSTITDIHLVEPASSILVEGRAAPAVLDSAKGADLVVLGARGMGGFAGLLLGSVSDQVARHAPCPVVIVRGPA